MVGVSGTEIKKSGGCCALARLTNDMLHRVSTEALTVHNLNYRKNLIMWHHRNLFVCFPGSQYLV